MLSALRLKKWVPMVFCCGATIAGIQQKAEAVDLTKKAKHFYEGNTTYIARSSVNGPWITSTPRAQGLDPEVLRSGVRKLRTIPSVLSFLVIRNGFLVKERYFHGSAANHSNNIHSASKGVISALVGLLLKYGFVSSLDEKLGNLLPDLIYREPAKANITLRHLLTMSAGFSWTEDETEYDIEKQPNWVQAIVDLPLTSIPGERFNYNTGQSHLVSAIITEATGMSTKAFAKKYLFRPLEVTIEHWGKDPQGYYSGGYNLYMTPRALAKFALLYRNKGKINNRRILPAAWVKESMKVSKDVDDADDDYQYGYYWWITNSDGRDIYQLWGYGGQFAYIIPSADMIVVITNNTKKNFPEMDGDEFLADYILPAIKR